MNLIKKLYVYFMPEKKYINYLRRQGVKIGNGCSIAKSVFFGSEPYLISIGDNVRLTSNVQFVTHDGGMWVLRNLNLVSKKADKFGQIKIGNNVNIGLNATIMPGVEIGDNVVIGLGAIVTKNVPSNSVAAGVPAKVIESIDEYSNKNKNKIIETKGLNYKEKRKFVKKVFKI